MPPLRMIDEIYTVVMKTVFDRYHRPQRSKVITDIPKAKFDNRLELSRRFKVYESGNGIYQVLIPDSNIKYITNLQKQTCDCTNFQEYASPCTHAIAACRHACEDPFMYFSPYYKLSTYRNTYERFMKPISIQDLTPTESIQPPKIKKQRGRPKAKRIRKGSWKRKPKKCSNCHRLGHDRRTCRNQPVANGRRQRLLDHESSGSEPDNGGEDDGGEQNELDLQHRVEMQIYDQRFARAIANRQRLDQERQEETSNIVESDSSLSTVSSSRFEGLEPDWWKEGGINEVRASRSRSRSQKRVHWTE